MNQHIFKPLGLALTTACLVAACATSSGPSVSGNWQPLGEDGSGNIRHALDTSSIRHQGGLATFRDKKTIVDIKQERFNNTPAYKVAIGTWEMDCTRKTFRLSALQLLDERGSTVRQEQYNASQMRPMTVIRGSASEQQYKRVCGKSL